MIKKYIAATAILISAGIAVVITATKVTETKITPTEPETVMESVAEIFEEEPETVSEAPVKAFVMEETTEEVHAALYSTKSETKASETEEETTESAFVGLTALAQVEGAVNVRKKPSTDSEIVGKIYNNCAAEILDVTEEKDGTWYLMESGDVRGYIKAEFFITGKEAEEKRDEIGTKTGTVLSEDGLNVRWAPDSTDPENIYTCFMPGVEVLVLNVSEDGWAEIDTDDGGTGFVRAEYLDIRTEFDTAMTLEQELEMVNAKTAAEEAAREAQEQYEAWLASQQTDTAAVWDPAAGGQAAAGQNAGTAVAAAQQTWWTPAPTPAATPAPTPAPTQQTWWTPAPTPAATPAPAPAAPVVTNSQLRNAVVAFALQYVGNPYVHGGRSLVTGTDCSGFTSLVYQNFGIYLSYTPAGQMTQGRAVALDQIQPGDLLFYPNDKTYPNVGHVAMYIGNGQIVHAGSEATGIQVREAFYRQPICARSFAD